MEYKARLAGVPAVFVDPRNTSRTYPKRGHVAKKDRPTRDGFECVERSFPGESDHIAAVNIGRIAVMLPYGLEYMDATHASSGFSRAEPTV